MTLAITLLALACVLSGAFAGVVITLVIIAAYDVRRSAALGTEHRSRGHVTASVVTYASELRGELRGKRTMEPVTSMPESALDALPAASGTPASSAL